MTSIGFLIGSLSSSNACWGKPGDMFPVHRLPYSYREAGRPPAIFNLFRKRSIERLLSPLFNGITLQSYDEAQVALRRRRIEKNRLHSLRDIQECINRKQYWHFWQFTHYLPHIHNPTQAGLNVQERNPSIRAWAAFSGALDYWKTMAISIVSHWHVNINPCNYGFVFLFRVQQLLLHFTRFVAAQEWKVQRFPVEFSPGLSPSVCRELSCKFKVEDGLEPATSGGQRCVLRRSRVWDLRDSIKFGNQSFRAFYWVALVLIKQPNSWT